MEEYKKYTMRIDWTSSEPYNPEDDAVDVVITDEHGETYHGNFVTMKFLLRMFDKNRQTQECASGTYFSMPGMIVVQRLDESSIRGTIDDLLQDRSFSDYFQTEEELSGKL